MKKSLLLAIGSFAITTAAFAQADEAFFKGDLQAIGKEQKALKAQEKGEHKTWKAQKAVLSSEKKADKAAVRNIRNRDVGFFTREVFYHDFGNVPVSSYEHGASWDVVSFTSADGPMKACYDETSHLIGTLSEKQFSDLPQKAQAYLNTKYAGYEKGRIILFDDNEANDNDLLFFGHTIDADNYFIMLTKDGQSQIMRVTMYGDVSFFSNL